MIKTNKNFYKIDGTTYNPSFYIEISIIDKNNIGINIINTFDNSTIAYLSYPHTSEVKSFLNLISKEVVNYLSNTYPNLDDLNITNLNG
jgi:hypothetical protein